MKLSGKLLIIFLGGLFFAFLFCGIFSVEQMRKNSIGIAADNYEKQLDSLAYVFSTVGTREDFSAMGDTAREAYLKYQFRKVYGNGFALLREDRPVLNLTEYEIVAPSLLSESYLTQKVGNRHVLLIGRAIPQTPEYTILLTQDITPYYRDVNRQTVRFIFVYAAILILTASVTAFLVKRALRPFRELSEAAVKIGNGSFRERVPVHGRDETGEFAEAFNEMAEKVERQVDDLQLLLGSLTHEMKTPMTAIIGYSESLLHVKLTEDQRQKALEHISRAGMRMERLSAKMLSLMGMYENQEIDLQDLTAKELFSEIAQEVQPVLSEKNLHLVMEIQRNSVIRADRDLFLCMLHNLAHNAAKASEPGGVILLRSAETVISVKDEGCGISPEDLPNVTRAFYMADKSRSRSEGGSGLGLTLCSRIAVLHGIKMEIKSCPGEGTEVLLHLPGAFTNHLQIDEDFGGRTG